jgi:DNA primase
MPDGLLRRQIVEELAQLARLPAAELSARWRLGPDRAVVASDPATRPMPTPRLAARPSAHARRGAASPASPADRAASLVARASELWSRLTHDDQDLLARLPYPHGPFFAWVDRLLLDQGPIAADALVAAATDSDEADLLRPLLERLQASLDWQDEAVEPADLDRTLALLRLQAVRDETDLLLASGASDPETRARHRLLLEQQTRLREALSSGGTGATRTPSGRPPTV